MRWKDGLERYINKWEYETEVEGRRRRSRPGLRWTREELMCQDRSAWGLFNCGLFIREMVS